MSEGRKPLDRDTSEGLAWCVAYVKDLQVGQGSCQVGNGVIINCRRTTGFAGESDNEFFQLCEGKELLKNDRRQWSGAVENDR